MKWCFLIIVFFNSLFVGGQTNVIIKSVEKESKSISRILSADSFQKKQIQNILSKRFDSQNLINNNPDLNPLQKFIKNSSLYYGTFAEIKNILSLSQIQKISTIIIEQDVLLQKFLDSTEAKALTKEEIYYLKMSWNNVLTPNNTL